jgi:hypothetical protein
MAKSFETSEILLMFSALSSAEKPRSLLRPCLMTSPSRMKTLLWSPRRLLSLALMAFERVDLPAPDNPVNQKVAPFSKVYLYSVFRVSMVGWLLC